VILNRRLKGKGEKISLLDRRDELGSTRRQEHKYPTWKAGKKKGLVAGRVLILDYLELRGECVSDHGRFLEKDRDNLAW